MSAQQIHKYEAGHSQINAARLIQFSRQLEVDITWFFDGLPILADGSMQSGTGPGTEEEYRLLEFFRTIADPKRRQKLVEIASLLVENY